jgi:hypothetical protein
LFDFADELRDVIVIALEKEDWTVGDTVEMLADMIQFVVREYEDD